MQASPKIIIFPVGSAEKSAEVIEFDSFQNSRGTSSANGVAIVRRYAVHFDRVKLVQAFPLQQGQCGNVVKGVTNIAEQHDPSVFFRHLQKSIAQHAVREAVGLDKLTALRQCID